jgi:hypothetical protein
MLGHFVMAVMAGGLPLTAQPPADSLNLRIVPECRVCRAGHPLFFFYHLATPKTAPLTVRNSAFEVADGAGSVVFSAKGLDSPLRDEVLKWGNIAGSYASAELEKKLEKLGAGDYSVRWDVNDHWSNRAAFTISAGDNPEVPLTIEALQFDDSDSEREAPAAFIAYLVNTGADTLGLPGALMGSQVMIDGISYRRKGIKWGGPGDLAPGGSWGVVLELAEYGSADARSVAAGVHEVQLMMGGELSNKLLLVIPRTTSFSMRP